MNKIILMGRLTAEPELRYSSKDSSMAIARYTLAVDRRFAKKEDGAIATDFIRCVAFGKAGEFASKYFHKGQRVLVEGRLQITTVKNESGTERRIFEIDANTVEPISATTGIGASATASSNEEIVKFPKEEEFADELIGEDEIPF